MTLRSKKSYRTLIYDLMRDILVICPKCKKEAIVRTPEQGGFPTKHSPKELKVVCKSCGFNKTWEETPVTIYKTNRKIHLLRPVLIGGAVDPYFRLPLWLTAQVGGNLLWAYNYEHLELLREHIAAKLRERNVPSPSRLNRSLGSRLPHWMTSHKNREALLKAIDRLKKQKISND